MAKISLRCNDCGGVMNVDQNREILCCPYCGSKAFVPESDDVKKERIRADAYKDVSIAEMAHKRELGKISARKDILSDFVPVIALAIVFLFILIIVLTTT